MQTDTSTATNPQPTPGLHHHRVMLMLSLAVIVAAFALQVQPLGRVGLPGIEKYPLPHTCLARSAFGSYCPGCGLTRSVIYLADGNWSSSFTIHRLGWVFGLLILLQPPYRLLALYRRNPHPLGTAIPWATGIVVITLLVGNWIYNVATRGLLV